MDTMKKIESHGGHVVEFWVEKTKSGYLAKGITIPSIITEAKTKKQLKASLVVATSGYMKAFPEEHDQLFGKKQQILEKLVLTV